MRFWSSAAFLLLALPCFCSAATSAETADLGSDVSKEDSAEHSDYGKPIEGPIGHYEANHRIHSKVNLIPIEIDDDDSEEEPNMAKIFAIEAQKKKAQPVKQEKPEKTIKVVKTQKEKTPYIARMRLLRYLHNFYVDTAIPPAKPVDLVVFVNKATTQTNILMQTVEKERIKTVKANKAKDIDSNTEVKKKAEERAQSIAKQDLSKNKERAHNEKSHENEQSNSKEDVQHLYNTRKKETKHEKIKTQDVLIDAQSDRPKLWHSLLEIAPHAYGKKTAGKNNIFTKDFDASNIDYIDMDIAIGYAKESTESQILVPRQESEIVENKEYLRLLVVKSITNHNTKQQKPQRPKPPQKITS